MDETQPTASLQVTLLHSFEGQCKADITPHSSYNFQYIQYIVLFYSIQGKQKSNTTLIPGLVAVKAVPWTANVNFLKQQLLYVAVARFKTVPSKHIFHYRQDHIKQRYLKRQKAVSQTTNK